MYDRVLLAYDGTVEGRAALREGALLAARFGSRVLLLAIVADTSAIRMAQGVHGEAISVQCEGYEETLEYGRSKLRDLGLEAEGRLEFGDPAELIGETARSFAADLVVVGHKRRGVLERWWSGPSGAYLIERIDCSLLVGRNIVSDEAFQAHVADRARRAAETEATMAGRASGIDVDPQG